MLWGLVVSFLVMRLFFVWDFSMIVEGVFWGCDGCESRREKPETRFGLINLLNIRLVQNSDGEIINR